MAGLVIRSPLSGWAAPLEEVPDPVFAEGMMGDGVAVDPFEGVLYAPYDGELIQLHRARHALTLRTAGGVEILVHLGLETVCLDGEGFQAFVRQGDKVTTGQKLIGFDLDLLALRAKSLISPVLVTNGEAFAITRRSIGRVVQAGDELFEIVAAAGAQLAPSGTSGGRTACRSVCIRHAHGLHARPAGLIAAEVKRLGLPVEIAIGSRKANARSPVALMGLGVRAGDELVLCASGDGAEAAVSALAEMIERDINGAPTHDPEPDPSVRPAKAAAGAIAGVRAAPGLAVGPAFRLTEPEVGVLPSSDDPVAEHAALERALADVRAGLVGKTAAARGPAREIMAAHLELLEDPELVEASHAAIASGQGAGAAWRGVLQGQIARLRGLEEPRLAERAADLADLERQVLLALGGSSAVAPAPPAGAIVLAEDLTPSQMPALQQAAGICTARGGPTSHVAILAAAMGLPALVAAGEKILEISDGAVMILDADAGTLAPAPTSAEVAAAKGRAEVSKARRTAAIAGARMPAFTADGARIEVFANVGALADAEMAVANGAEGCGLLRTEFLFQDRLTAPGETEQLGAYRAIAEAFRDRPVIVRTLDIGSDKPAAYLDLPASENPALGLRGVRVSLRHPDLLEIQLRAILGAWPEARCRIMIPMVSSASELSTVRRLADQAARDLWRSEPFHLGVMIETPAAAATADLIAADADFLSIGTNDLAQYTLAMDRGDPELAAEVDALHPAVLRLIRLTVEGAAKHGRPVGVCGGLASDLAAAPILIGLGVTELSAAPAAVPELKAMVRTLTLDACRDLAARACAEASAGAVRALELRQAAGAAP